MPAPGDITPVDELGISELENKQIEALKAGASREDIANLSRMPIENVPRMIDPVEQPDWDFEEPVEYSRPALNDATITNQAAIGAILSPVGLTDLDAIQLEAFRIPDMVKEFGKIKEELESGDYSPTLESIQNLLVSDTDKARKRIVEEALTDPDLSQKDKTSLVEGYLIERDRETGLARLYADRLSKIDSGDDEPTEAADLRFDVGVLLDEVIQSRIDQQKILNKYAAMSDTNLVPYVLDFLESMIPFSQVHLAKNVKEDVLDHIRGENDRLVRFEKVQKFVSQDKQTIKDSLYRVPVKERAELTEKVAEMIRHHSGILGVTGRGIDTGDVNDFESLYLLREILENGYYGDVEKWVDVIVQAIDVVGLFGPVKRGVSAAEDFLRGAKKGPRPSEFRPFEDYGFDVTIRPEFDQQKLLPGPSELGPSLKDYQLYGIPSPVSPLGLAKDINPEEARKMYNIALESEGDEMAKSLSGVGRTDLVRYFEFPKAGPTGRVVDSIPGEMQRTRVIHDQEMSDIVDFAFQPSGLSYRDIEKEKAFTRAWRDIHEVTGIHARPGMTRYDTSRGFVNIRAFYGANRDSGFSTAQEALDVTEFNLRHLGYKKEDFTLYIKDPVSGKYVIHDQIVTKGKELTTEGDYIVGVNYQYNYNPNDVDVFGTNVVNWKFANLLRVPGADRPLDAYLRDTSARFDDHVRLGAFDAVDRAWAIEKRIFDVALKDFKNLKPVSKIKILDIAKRSNAEETIFDEVQLITDFGLSKQEIKAMQQWYKMWDVVWEIRNRDWIRTNRNEGYKLFINKKSGDELVVKPISYSQANDVKLIYDPIDDSIRKFTPEELAEIYKNGGTVSRTRSEITSLVDQKSGKSSYVKINHIVTRQDTDNVLRGIRDDDALLNYREGYFDVNYENDYLLIEKFTDINGVQGSHTIGTTKTLADANMAKGRLEKNSQRLGTSLSYEVKRKREIQDPAEFRKAQWELMVNRGHSSQRFRGERLADYSGTFEEGKAVIRDPLEVMTDSVREVANRVSMRDVIESYQQRYMNSYGDLTGNKYPTSVKEIQSDNPNLNSKVADARAMYDLINQLKYASNATFDRGWKYVNMMIAETLEGPGTSQTMKGLAKVPRWLQESNPTRAARSVPYITYIGMNMFRQLVVQPSQVLSLITLEPRYMGSGYLREAPALIYSMLTGDFKRAAKLYGGTPEEMEQLVKQWRDSGLPYSIDSNILVEGAQTSIVDSIPRTKAGRAGMRIARAPKSVYRFSKKYGFDAAETFSLMSHWLVARNRGIQAGLDPNNPEHLRQMTVMAREMSWGMTRAGNLAYNDGIAGIITHFMSVPHKAMLSFMPGGNRAFSPKDKKKLFLYSVLGWGLFSGFAKWISDLLYTSGVTEEQAIDQETYDTIRQGILGAILDVTFDNITGRDTDIDYKSTFLPGSIVPWYELVSGFFEDPYTAFPLGSLMLGDESRLAIVYERVNEIMNAPAEDDLVQFFKAVEAGSTFFSGFSNAFKARMALYYKREYSLKGQELPGDIGSPEAFALMLGFGRTSTGDMFKVIKEYATTKESISKDIEMYYKAVKTNLLAEGVDTDKSIFNQRVQRRFWSSFKVEPEWKEFAQEEFRRIRDIDMRQSPEKSMVGILLKSINMKSREEAQLMIDKSPLTDEQKEMYRRTIDDVYNMREQ